MFSSSPSGQSLFSVVTCSVAWVLRSLPSTTSPRLTRSCRRRLSRPKLNCARARSMSTKFAQRINNTAFDCVAMYQTRKYNQPLSPYNSAGEELGCGRHSAWAMPQRDILNVVLVLTAISFATNKHTLDTLRYLFLIASLSGIYLTWLNLA